MRSFCLHATEFVLPGATMGEGYLPVHDGRLGHYTRERPDTDVVELGDAIVGPGLVDTHIHGFVGHDVMDLDADGVAEMCRALPRAGVTTWMPTTLTATREDTRAACASVADYVREAAGEPATRVGGIHLEGPFFTLKYKGAQNEAYMCDPSMDAMLEWAAAADGLPMKISIAPERDGAPEFCAQASAKGFVVSLGHADAGIDDVLACVNAGATQFTHTYNGMRGLHHREPGMVGGAMASHGTYVEVICDGLHVNPVAVRALVAAKGWEHVMLISDCMRAGGMPDGDYTLGELPVVVANGAARLRDGGNLAGSILRLCVAVKNVVDWHLVSPDEAIRMASEVPARACGLGDVAGALVPGRPADLVVFDRSLDLRATYVAGEVAYQA